MSTLPVRKTAWRGIIFPFTHFMPLARRLGLTIAIGAGVLALQMFVLPSMLLAGSLSFEVILLKPTVVESGRVWSDQIQLSSPTIRSMANP